MNYKDLSIQAKFVVVYFINFLLLVVLTPVAWVNKNDALVVMICFFVLVATMVYSYHLLRKYFIIPIRVLKKALIALESSSDFPEIKHTTKDDLGKIGLSSISIKNQIEAASSFVKDITEGNFNTKLNVSDTDRVNNKHVLATALMDMSNKLKHISDEEKTRKWVNEGLAHFAELMRKSDNLKDLGDQLLSELVNYLGMNQGTIYLAEYKDRENLNLYDAGLKMISCYAFGRKKFIESEVKPGEGLIGQAYLEKDYLYLTEIPDNYIRITSGLGDANPSAILIVPMIDDNGIVEGVIELASFKKLESYKIDFTKKICQNLASTIARVRINENTKKLLELSRIQGEELRANEEEMRQNMEELQATQEEMNRRKTELEVANRALHVREEEMRQNMEELEATQEEMALKQKQLAKANEAMQKNEIALKEKMIELEEAKAIMEERQGFLEKVKNDALEKQKRLDSIIKNNPGIIYRCKLDDSWTMLFASPKALDITGYTAEEFMTGKVHLADLILPEDSAKVNEDVAKGLKQEGKFSSQYRIKTKAGEIKWVLDSGTSVAGDTAQENLLEGLIFDITEQKTLEEAMQQQLEEIRSTEEELRQNMEELQATQEEMSRAQKEIQLKEGNLNALINNTKDTIFAIDKNYIITVVNDTLYNKYKSKGLVLEAGTAIKDILPQDAWQTWKAKYDRALAGEQFSDIASEKNSAGEITYKQTYHNPIKDEKGKIIGVSVISRDVTDLVKAKEEASLKENTLNAFINNTTDTYFAIDTNYKIVLANKTLKDRFAASNIDLSEGKSIFEVLPAEEQAVWKERYDKALKGEVFSFMQERPSKNKTLQLSVTVSPVFDTDGNIIGCAVSSIDKTEQFQLMESLRKLTN